MLPQEDYTQGLQQGLDRVTQILNQRAAPQDNFSMQSQGLAMPPNIAQMLLGQSLTTGKPYGDIALNYVEQQRKSQMDDANSMLNVLKQQAALGEARSKSVIDKIQMFTGNDPEGQAMFLSELANSPEDIDPMNSTQVLSKLAAIKRKSGYESPELALERSKTQTDIDYKRAMIRQANAKANNLIAPQAKPSQLQKTLSSKIAEDIQSVNQDAGNIRTIESNLGELETLMNKGVSTGKLAQGAAALDVGNFFQNTRNLQKMEQLVNSIALPKTASLKGATSDKDVKFVKDAFANAGQSPEANQYAIDIGKRFVNRQKAVIETYNDMISDPKYSTQPELFYKDLQAAINSLPSLEEEVKGGSPQVMHELPDPMQHSGRTITNTDTGQKYKSNGREWIPQ